jgi:GAF domain-containing protein/HAMP domain-containing protein
MTHRRLKFTVIGPLLIALILVVMFAFQVVFGALYGRGVIKQEVLNVNKATLLMVSRVLSAPLYDTDLDTVRRILAELPGGDTSVVHAAVRDVSGQVIAEARGAWSPSEQDGLELADEAFEAGEVRWREFGGYLVLSGPITAGQQQIGTLQLTFDQSRFQSALGAMQFPMAGVALTLVAVAVVVVGAITRYALSPLRELTAASEEIGRGNLNVAVPIRGTQEMAALGVALERMRADLLALYRDLEQQVSSLERRARYQEATAAVARGVASMLDLEDLLSRTVTQVSGQLGFYHTGVFLLDPTGEWAELRAASSEGGKRMLVRRHRLPVAEEGIVGYVASRGEARVASDIGEDAAYFDNPDLPETRSEVALPLRARGEILGVLDVHSKEREAFTEEDVAVLQTLADQVATAISNARLFGQVQEALEAERRAYGEMSLTAWAEALRGRGAVGYHCDADAIVPVTESVKVEDDGLPALDIPITVHDQVIGTIRARKPKDTGEWTAEETDLMAALVEQLGLALESARLYQDTQRRAAHERLVGEMAARMRETLDVDTVLQTAIRSMGETLDIAEVEVRMRGGAMTES